MKVQKVAQILRDTFSLDRRSLALLRILLSLVLLADLGIRISDLHAFYTDAGIVSRSLLQNAEYGFSNPYFFSLLNISGHWLPILLLYLASFIAVLHVLVGYRTKWFTFLAWVLILSIQNRNPFIIQGGDGYLRLILFWGMFLPWGERFSVDALKLKNKKSDEYFGLAGVAYIVQVIMLYLFTALLKNGEEWRSSFTAMYYALSLDQLVKPIGKALLDYPDLLEWLTMSTLYVELLIPLLLVIPYKKHWFRGVALILLLGLHFSIELMLQVGLFSFISIAAASGLAPAGFIDRIRRKFAGFESWCVSKFKQYKSFWQSWPSIKVSWTLLNLKAQKLISTSIISIAFVIGIIWNISTLYNLPPTVSKIIDPVGAFARLDQHWGMFAPAVFKDDGWFIKEGFTGASKIDLYTYPDSLSYEKPRYAVRQFKSARWRKFGENIIFIDNIPVRGSYCKYELEKWNRNHPDQPLDSLKIVYMMEVTLPDYQIPEVTREELCTCYSSESQQSQ